LELPKEPSGDWWLDKAVQERIKGDRLLIREAARIAYEAIERLPFGAFLRREYPTPDRQLDHLIRAMLCAEPPFEILAAKPPSTVPHPIDPQNIGQFQPVRGTNDLRRSSESVPFTNATVAREDLRRFIKAVKELPADAL
jgi:hypothetical protein